MTFRKTTAAHFLFIIVLSVAACNRVTTPHNSTPSAPPKTATYAVNGVLREVSADRRKAVIAHEAIPGYMDAMTMEFDVRDSALPNGLEPGGRVAFQLSVTETRSWIDQVRKLGRAPESQPAVTPPATSNAISAQPGMPLPDCALVDQLGQAFHLGDFKGRALAFTFIFTRCPLPDFCPRMNRNLAEVQRELSVAGASANWHLLSISFDPEYDTPARLAEYARPYGIESGHWTFATGATEDIQKLGGAFDLGVVRNGTQIDHTLRTVVVDATGRVQRIFVGNDWKAAELIDEMRRAMTVKP